MNSEEKGEEVLMRKSEKGLGGVSPPSEATPVILATPNSHHTAVPMHCLSSSINLCYKQNFTIHIFQTHIEHTITSVTYSSHKTAQSHILHSVSSQLLSIK